MLFAERREKYVNTLRHGQKAADMTYVGYQSHLNRYQRYPKSGGFTDVDVEYALSVDAVETCLFWLSKRGLRPRSIKGKFDPIRGMIKYLIRRKVLSETPLDQLTFGSLGAAERLTVSTSEVEALWAACLKRKGADNVKPHSLCHYLAVTGLGMAVKFIPRSVVIGFTNGIALLIASAQIKELLGLTPYAVPSDFLGRDQCSPGRLGWAG